MKSGEKRFTGLLLLAGPGILVAATGVGAGDLATAAFSGNRLGLAVLWAVLLGAFLKFVLNEGLARWQLATRETLLEGAVHHLGRPVMVIFFPYLILWSFFVGTALMSACGVAMHAIIPVFAEPAQGKVFFGILHSIAGVILVKAGGFKLFKKVMLLCIGIMFLVVVSTAVILCRDWGAVASGLFIPQIPLLEGPGLGWTVALMGGVGGTLTVLCYGYWMRETGRTGPGHLRTCRVDLGLAYGATALFGVSMVIIGSSIPELPTGGGASLIVQLANLLESSTGTIGRWAFLLGAWSAIFSSLLGVWQAVPYLFADFWHLSRRQGNEPVTAAFKDRITASPAYNIYLYLLATIPMLGLVVNFSMVQKVYAVFGALFMPMLALVLIRLNGKREWVNHSKNRPLTVGILYGILFLFIVFGFLQLRKDFL